MSEADRTQAHAVFNKIISIHVPDVASQAAFDKRRCVQRILVVTLCVNVGSARDKRVGPLLQRLGSVEFHDLAN